MAEERTAWPLLIATVLLLALLQLWLRPLLPVDETRYLSVAWEMWSRGDLLVPWLNDEAYSHKPPLLFWMIHGLWALFGVSELPPRLLPVMLSLVALYGAAVLAGQLWPTRARAIKPLVPWLLFGGLFWMNFYTLVQFDLLLVLAALGAWLGTLRACRSATSGWTMVAVAVGLGILAKGPVILLPVVPVILLAPWWRRETPPARWWPWYLGAALALLAGIALALAWAIPAGLAGGETYRQAIFWGQSAGRILSSFAHRAPWWSYLVWLPVLWLPWLAWPPVWRGLRRLSLLDPGVRFCLAVLLPALLLFSLISGKQGKYLLPLLPLLALLTARALTDGAPASDLYRVRLAAGVLLLLGIVLMILPWLSWAGERLTGMRPWWGLLPVLCAVPLMRWRLARNTAVRVTVLAMWLATATLYAGVVDRLAPQVELRPLALQLAGLQQSGRAIAWLGKYHGQFQFLGRLRAPLEPLADARDLRAWLAVHPRGYLLVNYRGHLPEVPATLRIQPYRSGNLVLWPASELRRHPRHLDALVGNA